MKKYTDQQTIKFPKKKAKWWELLYLPVKQAKEEAKKQTFPKKQI